MFLPKVVFSETSFPKNGISLPKNSVYFPQSVFLGTTFPQKRWLFSQKHFTFPKNEHYFPKIVFSWITFPKSVDLGIVDLGIVNLGIGFLFQKSLLQNRTRKEIPGISFLFLKSLFPKIVILGTFLPKTVILFPKTKIFMFFIFGYFHCILSNPLFMRILTFSHFSQKHC